jgi:hypothetical protein
MIACLITAGCERPDNITNPGTGIPPSVPVGLEFVYADDSEILISRHDNPVPDLKGYNVYPKINKTAFPILAFAVNDYYYDDSLDSRQNNSEPNRISPLYQSTIKL